MSISNIFSVAVNSPVGQTALAAAASALSAGQSASFPHNPNSTQYDIQWCIRGHYDPVRRCVQYSGKPASSQSHNWSHNYYDEATATWTRQSAFYTGTNPSGHVWGGHDIDPTTGDYYLHLYKTATVAKRVTGGSGAWTIDATSVAGSGTDGIGGTGTTGPSNGLAWHPNLFGTNDPGFIIGTKYKIKAWRKNTDTWSNPTVSPGYISESAGGSLYLPGADVAIIGSGDDSFNLYSVAAGSGGAMATIQRRGPTPREVFGAGGSATNSSKMIVDPRDSSTIMLLGSNDSSAVHISTDLGASWSSDGTHPFSSLLGSAFTANSWIATSISSYGVVWVMSDTVSFLWKPA